MGQAQELMADAVDADHAFFSTRGSSLSLAHATRDVRTGLAAGMRIPDAADPSWSPYA